MRYARYAGKRLFGAMGLAAASAGLRGEEPRTTDVTHGWRDSPASGDLGISQSYTASDATNAPSSAITRAIESI